MGKIIWIIVIFLVIGGYIIYDNLEVDLNNDNERNNFIKEVGKWLFQVSKSTQNTVGYAIQQDWLPDVNESNSTS
jgi:hypothetical protein